ncbi:MAG: DUF1353 domain-containing protein [Actinomycetota bacterium]
MKAFVRELDRDPVRIEASRLPPPVVSYVTGTTWRLEEAYAYLDGDHTITVPAKFEFDMSSIPRWLWWLIAPFELSVAAPLLHDFLYRYSGAPPPGTVDPPRTYSRRQADDLFREVMEKEGVAAWRRTVGYWVVRAFSFLAWGKF